MPSQARLFIYLVILAFVFIQPQSSLGQSGDQKPIANGSVSGRVTVGGKAASGIAVAAIAGDTINRPNSATRAVTDGEGNYRLRDLLPGQYQIWALTPGLIAELEPFPGYFPYGSVKSVLLSANEDVANVDLKLISGCVITGRITNVENEPIVEERVLLEFLDEHGNPRFPVQRSREDMYRTDDRGVYRIYGLPPGRYKVSVGYEPNEGLRGSLYSRTYYSEPGDPSKAVVVELKEGREAEDIDIKVTPPINTFSVSGRITDGATGRPIPGARYRIALVEKDSSRSPAFVGLPSDDSGEFRFEGLRPGRYTIAVSSEYFGGGNFYGDPVSFEIMDQDVTGLEVKAIRGVTLSGAVIAEGLSTRELLSLLPDLRVFAWPESPTPNQRTGSGSAAVAADGSFQITGLRPGRVRIHVDSMARNAIRPTVARIEREGIAVGQMLDIQQSVSGIVVAINYGTGSIRGTMTFVGGDLPADSRIFVNVRREGERDATSVQTDVRGNFVINSLAPGTYELNVQLAFSNRAPRARQPEKQSVNVTNGSVSEVSFLVDFSQTRPGP